MRFVRLTSLLSTLTADGGVGADDLSQPRAVDIGNALEIEKEIAMALLHQVVDSLFQEFIAPPIVKLPLRSKTTTFSSDLSSISMETPSVRPTPSSSHYGA